MLELILWPFYVAALLVAVEVEEATECEQPCVEQVVIEEGREK